MAEDGPRFADETEAYGYEEAHEAADEFGERIATKDLRQPRIAVVTGSGGMGAFVQKYTHPDTRLAVPTHDIRHFSLPRQQALGHAGQAVVAPIKDGEPETMLVFDGRVHFYQKLCRALDGVFRQIDNIEVKAAAVGFYVAICRAMGIQDIITTNAVGAVNAAHYKVGEVALVTDHVMGFDLDFGVPEDERWFADHARRDSEFDYRGDEYFYNQANLYSPELAALAQTVAGDLGIELRRGEIFWRPGRGYESPAQIRSLQRSGSDFVAMSTAPEAQRARSVGYTNKPGEPQFGSFSLVTNLAQMNHHLRLSGGEVTDVGQAAEERVCPLVHELICRRVLTPNRGLFDGLNRLPRPR